MGRSCGSQQDSLGQMGDSVPSKRKRGVGDQGHKYFQSCIACKMEVELVSTARSIMGQSSRVQIWRLEEFARGTESQ